jgi:hypothetical protein
MTSIREVTGEGLNWQGGIQVINISVGGIPVILISLGGTPVICRKNKPVVFISYLSLLILNTCFYFVLLLTFNKEISFKPMFLLIIVL